MAIQIDRDKYLGDKPTIMLVHILGPSFPPTNIVFGINRGNMYIYTYIFAIFSFNSLLWFCI